MHALADDLRPRRSLWLSRRARWSAIVVAALVVLVLAGSVVHRLTARPYAFDELDRPATVTFPDAAEGPGTRVWLDGGRAFVGFPTAGDRFAVHAVDAGDPSARPAWTNAGLARVESFRMARGSVLVTGRPDNRGVRRITLLNASNGVPFAEFDVDDQDRWELVGRYFVRYELSRRRLQITDVGKPDRTITLDQPAGPGSWWLTRNWSGEQVPTSVGGDVLDEPLTVDPYIVRAVADQGLEVVSLATGRPMSAATGVADPEDLVHPYEEQIFVADRVTLPYRVRAADRAKPGVNRWTWTSPDPKAHPAAVATCGERRVCVVEERRLTALDTRTGDVVFRVDLQLGDAAAARLLPVGDRLAVRHTGADGKPATSLLDAAGRTVRTWPGVHAARVDAGSFFLLPADLPAGPPAAPARPVRFTGVAVAGSAGGEHLGAVDTSLDSCTWSHTALACAGPGRGQFAFYRVRAPWYSGLL